MSDGGNGMWLVFLSLLYDIIDERSFGQWLSSAFILFLKGTRDLELVSMR